MTKTLPGTVSTRLALAALALSGTCCTALASLGGNLESIGIDGVHMKAKAAAQVTTSSTASYTLHVATLPSGTVVRQYLSANGIVFAVTWSGPFKPDLRQLLGPHFDTMITRQSGTPHAGHPFTHLHEDNLVIESRGHARSFFGRAYLPNAIPAGVSPQDIQ